MLIFATTAREWESFQWYEPLVWILTGLKRRMNLTHLLDNSWAYNLATGSSFFSQKKKKIQSTTVSRLKRPITRFSENKKSHIASSFFLLNQNMKHKFLIDFKFKHSLRILTYKNLKIPPKEFENLIKMLKVPNKCN